MRRVVITGMGTINPIGNNTEEFKEALFAGKNGIAEITRFDTSESRFKVAGEVKNFDAVAALGKPTVRKTDLFTQYALVAAKEAMEQSGVVGTMESDRIGVCFGSGIGGIETLTEDHQNLLEKGARKVSPHFVPKMIYNIAAGNIAIEYKANGPCTAVSTACATGTTAIGEGYRTILHGYADAMICGGSEAAITPICVAGFGNCQALSDNSDDPELACTPFDKRRSGFVMAEGAGVLVLEEYEHAVARGANILAEVVGYGSTCDAHHVTAPDPEAKFVAKAFLQACPEGIDLSKVYVNAHGTSTPLNDKTETLALKRAFGEEGAKQLHISSTKSMTGHMLGATGAVEAIASILALQNDTVPPTIHYSEPDPELDLDYTPNTAVQTPLEVALSSNLGFGGHNAVIAFRKV